ncbi:LysE family translocator [Acinetobacter soli]|uniref:Lysine transporter LysE n=1 Tax=Acinetobacter soli TaxID=487316 RepID=A0A1P8ENE5_9GAMM|nr:LysE family translocator [Acinetobacter soli]APV37748.1 lysine transporter LysE [Acinetobacter soli]
MQNLMLYILIASLTIASPGPGVLLTLTNTIHYTLKNAFVGILGVSAGMGIIAIVAASSLGIIITSSPIALSIVKVIGAAYLVYLGLKLFKSAPKKILDDSSMSSNVPSHWKRFREGMLVSLLNPKPIVFFMALFPQFVDVKQPFLHQFFILGSTFCILVILIHLVYAIFAQTARKKIGSSNGFIILNRVGGSVFMLFAAALISSVILPLMS